MPRIIAAMIETGRRETDESRRLPWLARLWLATPDWLFRVIGLLFFAAYLASGADEYAHFPRMGPYIQFGSQREYFPLTKVLVDLSFLLIALAFVVRRRPIQRASSIRTIVLPLISGFWPLMPFGLLAVLKLMRVPAAKSLADSLGFGIITRNEFYLGVGLLSVGMALEVWAYAYLVRSLSIVAEARALITRGPYRWVRHPIYLGQFIAQAAYWLVLVQWSWTWAAFYVCFVLMQLARSRVEDRVLAEAFGEAHTQWRVRAKWFV